MLLLGVLDWRLAARVAWFKENRKLWGLCFSKYHTIVCVLCCLVTCCTAAKLWSWALFICCWSMSCWKYWAALGCLCSAWRALTETHIHVSTHYYQNQDKKKQNNDQIYQKIYFHHVYEHKHSPVQLVSHKETCGLSGVHGSSHLSVDFHWWCLCFGLHLHPWLLVKTKKPLLKNSSCAFLKQWWQGGHWTNKKSNTSNATDNTLA